MKVFPRVLMLALATTGCVSSVLAADTYINTGVSLSGSTDLRWKVGTNQTSYLTSASLYNNAAYTAPFSGPSAWIGTNSYAANSTRWYTLEFNLDASFFSNNVGLNIKWSSDNESYLFLNDNTMDSGLGDALALHPYGSPGNYSFNNTSTFLLTAGNGLVVGNNILQFGVRNDGTSGTNPNALRAEFSATPVPEPFTLALGAAGIGLAIKRRRGKRSA